MARQFESWLRLTKEKPLDPDLPICDPHHHLWDYPDSYPENRIELAARPMRHYLLEHLLRDIAGGHNIVQTVFVECGSMYKKDGPQELRPVGETEFVQGIAAQSWSGQYGNTAVATGIIGFADLMLGSEAARIIEAHITASSRFRGIRFRDANLLSDPKLRQGFAQLRKYNLSFDSFLFFQQIPYLTNLARAFPDTTIILNHIGTPVDIGPFSSVRDEVFQEWKKNIAELATCPNANVKLGGLGMPFCGFEWDKRKTPINSVDLAESTAPYYLWCIDRFGVKRCMFESNFPVDKLSYSYTVVWNAFKLITKAFSSEERANLFYDTAVRVYRLK
jgi:predicted TIM-barrel fold metal-dependent hydrolase